MSNLAPYLDLIIRFVENELPIQEFEQNYLSLFKNEKSHIEEPIFGLLHDLFIDVDRYCPYGYLFDAAQDLSEFQLREAAKNAYEQIIMHQSRTE